MANVSKPAGLIPVQYANGNPWNGQARTYYIPSTDTNSYAIGDPVSTLAAGADANGVPGVVLATAGTGNALRGVVVGVGAYETLMADPSNLNTTVVPAIKLHAYYVMVVDDPDVLFQVQENGTALTAAAAGQNINLSSAANNGYVSQWTLLNSSLGTGATLQMKLYGLIRTADNAFGTNAKWLCKINNHELNAGTVGV
jgi:hypothetical protein